MRADVALGALLAAFFAAIVLAALDYRWEAAAAPLLAAGSGLILCAVLLFGSFRAVRLEEPSLTRRDAAAVATFVASIAAVLLFGFVLGGAVYIFACLRISAGLSLRNSAIAAISAAAVVHFVFQRFVGAVLFGGFLIERFSG